MPINTCRIVELEVGRRCEKAMQALVRSIPKPHRMLFTCTAGFTRSSLLSKRAAAQGINVANAMQTGVYEDSPVGFPWLDLLYNTPAAIKAGEGGLQFSGIPAPVDHLGLIYSVEGERRHLDKRLKPFLLNLAEGSLKGCYIIHWPEEYVRLEIERSINGGIQAGRFF